MRLAAAASSAQASAGFRGGLDLPAVSAAAVIGQLVVSCEVNEPSTEAAASASAYRVRTVCSTRTHSGERWRRSRSSSGPCLKASASRSREGRGGQEGERGDAQVLPAKADAASERKRKARHTLDGGLGLVVRLVGDEAEATRPSSLPVRHDDAVSDVAILREGLAESLGVDAPREVADEAGSESASLSIDVQQAQHPYAGARWPEGVRHHERPGRKSANGERAVAQSVQCAGRSAASPTRSLPTLTASTTCARRQCGPWTSPRRT